jgi:hypothetical protein
MLQSRTAQPQRPNNNGIHDIGVEQAANNNRCETRTASQGTGNFLHKTQIGFALQAVVSPANGNTATTGTFRR